MTRDESLSHNVGPWCENVDTLCNKHKLAVVIVHHMVKTGQWQRGSGRYDGWLDTIADLKPVRGSRHGVTMSITGRDTDPRDIKLNFKYPVWAVDQIQARDDQSKVGQVTQCLIALVDGAPGKRMEESRLKLVLSQRVGDG